VERTALPEQAVEFDHRRPQSRIARLATSVRDGSIVRFMNQGGAAAAAGSPWGSMRIAR
jgi:uncharacterized membrane protein